MTNSCEEESSPEEQAEESSSSSSHSNDDDVVASSSSGGRRGPARPAVVVAATTIALLLLACSVARPRRHLRPPDVGGRSRYDDDDDELVRELNAAEFRGRERSRSGEERRRRDARLRLRADASSAKFGDEIVVSWSGGDGSFRGDGDGDAIALCGPASEPDPRKFRHAASIGDDRARRGPGRTAPKEDDGGRWRRFWTSPRRRATEDSDPDRSSWRVRSFPIVRGADDCEFRLWKRLRPSSSFSSSSSPSIEAASGTTETVPPTSASPTTFELVGASNPIRLRRPERHGDHSRTPTAVHLALTSKSPDEMSIQFAILESGNPVVKYGPKGQSLDQKAEGTSDTYEAKDMCSDPATSTGDGGKFFDPGTLHAVTLEGLKADAEYDYAVGASTGQGIAWSDPVTFRTPPAVGSNAKSFSYLVYGDQGRPAGGKDLLKSLVAREVDGGSKSNVVSVHHLGGLSLARGDGKAWDDWFDMISPLSVRVPIMIAVGNDEYDHASSTDKKDPSGVTTPFAPSWGNMDNDSGGECGVPASKRFTMPSNGNGVFWYSYDVGSIHTIVISSEHDLRPGSPQHKWLESDLKNVNRKAKTPWLVVESHRPMYHSEMVWEDNAVGLGMRSMFEPLLRTYRVDLFLAGHYKSYVRTCDGLYQSKCRNGGPTHVTVGGPMGGAEYNGTMYEQNWTEAFATGWGYGRVTVANATALHWEYLDTTGKVRDEVWIARRRGS